MGLSARFTYTGGATRPRFCVVPALAGARRTHAAIKRWLERLPRILPVKEVLGCNAAWGIAEAVAPPYSIDRKAG
jgi:hypothetical protein